MSSKCFSRLWLPSSVNVPSVAGTLKEWVSRGLAITNKIQCKSSKPLRTLYQTDHITKQQLTVWEDTSQRYLTNPQPTWTRSEWMLVRWDGERRYLSIAACSTATPLMAPPHCITMAVNRWNSWQTTERGGISMCCAVTIVYRSRTLITRPIGLSAWGVLLSMR